MKFLIFPIFLLSCILGNAQSTATGNCWKCQLAYLNQSNSVAERCQTVIKSSSNLKEINIARLILARHEMNIGEYEKARKQLSICSFDGLFFPAIKLGLLGDTYVEEGNFTEAYTLYREAAAIHSNDLTTPHYLFKAYLCAKKLDSIELADKLLSTITIEFGQYASTYHLNRYLTTKYIEPFPIYYDSITQPKNLGIGTISGKKIDERDFLNVFNKNQKIADRIAAQQQEPPAPIDENTVWNSYTEQLLIHREIEILGLTVSEEELESYILGTNGFTVMEDLRRAFTNPETDEYDPKILISRIQELQESDDQQMRDSWHDTKEYYIEKRLQEKYFEYVQLINYRTKLEIEFLEPSNDAYSIEYTSLQFKSIDDESIHFEQEDLRAFYEKEKHKKNYFNKLATVKLQFVNIPLTTSKKDSVFAQNEMERLKVAFSSSSNDSSFVIENSELRFYSSGPYSTTLSEDHRYADQHQTYPREMDSIFRNAKIGEIVGPYWDDTTIVIAKILGHTYDSIRARHIILPHDSYEEPLANMKKAKELLAQLTNENFNQFALQYSIDKGSAKKGGDLGYFFFSQMVQPFAVFCSENPVGELGIVKSQFGIHIVQVTDRKGPKNPKVALIVKRFVPSSFTLDSIKRLSIALSEQLQGDFESKTSELEMFGATLNTLLTPTHIYDATPKVYGFNYRETEDEILRFAFNPERKRGDHAYISRGNEIAIVLFEAFQEVGTLDFNSVLNKIESEYIENEKYAILANQLSLLDYSTETAIVKTTIQEGDYIINNNYEPNLICEIIRINDDQLPQIIKGKLGAYKVYTKTKTSPKFNSKNEESALKIQKNSEDLFSTDRIMRAIESDAHIVDNRRLYRLGIRK